MNNLFAILVAFFLIAGRCCAANVSDTLNPGDDTKLASQSSSGGQDGYSEHRDGGGGFYVHFGDSRTLLEKHNSGDDSTRYAPGINGHGYELRAKYYYKHLVGVASYYFWGKDEQTTEYGIPQSNYRQGEYLILGGFYVNPPGLYARLGPVIGYGLMRTDGGIYKDVEEPIRLGDGERIFHTTRSFNGPIIGGMLQFAISRKWSFDATYLYRDYQQIRRQGRFELQYGLYDHEADLNNYMGMLVIGFMLTGGEERMWEREVYLGIVFQSNGE